MEKIEKICCPILNEIKKTNWDSVAMGRPEVFILFDDGTNKPKKIMGCPDYHEKKCTNDDNDGKECVYSKGFQSL